MEKTCKIIEKEVREYDDYDRYITYHYFYCSSCSYEFGKQDCPYCETIERIYNFCPQCGSKIQVD